MPPHATTSGVWCVSLHPGTTDTGLSKPFQKNVKPEKLFTTEFTVSQVGDGTERHGSLLTGRMLVSDDTLRAPSSPKRSRAHIRATTQLLGVVESMDVSHTGGFFAWDGQEIEW